MYIEFLGKFGFPREDIVFKYETKIVRQLKTADTLARENKTGLIIVSANLEWLVRFLCWRYKIEAEHRTTESVLRRYR